MNTTCLSYTVSVLYKGSTKPEHLSFSDYEEACQYAHAIPCRKLVWVELLGWRPRKGAVRLMFASTPEEKVARAESNALDELYGPDMDSWCNMP